MSTHERTPAATAVCLVLVVAAYWLLFTLVDWPTSRLGRAPSESEILLYDVLPDVVAGFVIGLGAIAITRFMFPMSSIKIVLYVVGVGAVLVALAVLALSNAIGGPRNIRDFGMMGSFFAVPLAIATWALISSCRSRREAR